MKEIPFRYRLESNTLYRNVIIHLMKKCKNNSISKRLYKSFIKLLYNDMIMKLVQNVSFILSIINTGFITDINKDI